MRAMRMRWAWAVALAISAPTNASAGERLSIMVGGIEKIIYLPAKLAEQLGYFSDEGLEVELQSERSGVHAEDELLSGSVHGVVGFYDHTIDLQAKGKAVMSVVQFSQAPGEVELVSARDAEGTHSIADLAGKNLGVTGLGSSTHFLSQYLAVAAGLKLNQVNFIPVGTGDTFINAMRQGSISAGMTTEPTVSRLLKSGEARILVDLRTPEGTQQALGGLYPAACLYMQSAWVNRNKPQVQKLVNALVRALKYIQMHSASEIASQLPGEFYAGDKSDYVKALANGKAMFIPDGRMPAAGPATVLRVLSRFDRNVQGKSIDLSRTFTLEFVAAVK